MTCAAQQREFVPYFRDKASTSKSKAVANKAGILRRIFDAIIELNQKQDERDIARFLARSGGCLTDHLERQMTQSLLRGNWKATK